VAERQQWGSRIGFILAASGAAIGLGNIVFFAANAYRYGAGAFYLPYLIALITVGVPLMIAELGMGQRFRRAFPGAMAKAGGPFGEFVGWFAVLNTLVIVMYYLTMIGWAAGMWWAALTGSLFQEAVEVTALQQVMQNPDGSFFQTLTAWSVVVFVVLAWGLNTLGLYWGTDSIERVVKRMIPFIWVVMIYFLVRGFMTDGGLHGFYLLFRPEFEVMKSPQVWGGAFAQIFFTLGLGMGIMTAYASYLPKGQDHVANGITICGMNCTFEMIAGTAVFTLLFAYTVTPQASTLGMMFFVIPKTIMSMSVGAQFVGALFFTLLLAAGITSSISMFEATLAPLNYKFKHIPRRKVLLIMSAVGVAGSIAFAIPTVIDPSLESSGTLGLSLLDLVTHYSFNFGLLLIGLVECIVLGWIFPLDDLRKELNESSSIKLGKWFNFLIQFFVPAVLLFLVIWNILADVGLIGDTAGEFPTYFGADMELGAWGSLVWIAPLMWVLLTVVLGIFLTYRRGTDAKGNPMDDDDVLPVAETEVAS